MGPAARRAIGATRDCVGARAELGGRCDAASAELRGARTAASARSTASRLRGVGGAEASAGWTAKHQPLGVVREDTDPVSRTASRAACVDSCPETSCPAAGLSILTVGSGGGDHEMAPTTRSPAITVRTADRGAGARARIGAGPGRVSHWEGHSGEGGDGNDVRERGRRDRLHAAGVDVDHVPPHGLRPARPQLGWITGGFVGSVLS
jgi:hypothetical protein